MFRLQLLQHATRSARAPTMWRVACIRRPFSTSFLRHTSVRPLALYSRYAQPSGSWQSNSVSRHLLHAGNFEELVTMDDSLVVVDERKMVIVRAPSLLQKVWYYVSRVCAVLAAGISVACVVVLVHFRPFASLGKEGYLYAGVTPGIPSGLLSSLLLFWYRGQYTSVQQWKQLRSEGLALEFSDIVQQYGLPRAAVVLTPLELRRKFCSQLESEGAHVAFLGHMDWHYPKFFEHGMITQDELELLGLIQRRYQSLQAQHKEELLTAHSAYEAEVEKLRREKEQNIGAAVNRFTGSSEYKLEKELNAQFKVNASDACRTRDEKLHALEDLTDSEEKARRAKQIRQECDKTVALLKQLREAKQQGNERALRLRERQRDDEIGAIERRFEAATNRVYERHGLSDLKRALTSELNRKVLALQKEWEPVIHEFLMNEADTSDIRVPPGVVVV